MSNSNSKQSFDYYVALDLGSESMAAYYRKADDPEGAMIDLLEHAEAISGYKVVEQQILGPDGRRSNRMRSQISLEHDKQPKPLPLDHARINLLDANERKKCIFTYFHGQMQQTKAGPRLPNPKIPFQFGSEGIVPKVADDKHQLVQHSPEQLLQHAT